MNNQELSQARFALKEYRSIQGKNLQRLRLVKNNPERYKADYLPAYNALLLATQNIQAIYEEYPQLKPVRVKQYNLFKK